MADDLGVAETKRILDERARALARPIVIAEEQADVFAAVVFELGTETYAIDARYVREVARAGAVVTLPGTPPHVIGAARIRGEIHAVFDIGTLSGGSPAGVSSDSKILALGQNRVEFGLLADAVVGITRLSASDIRVTDASRNELFQGATRDATTVIDPEALLNERKLYVGIELDQYGEDEDGGRT